MSNAATAGAPSAGRRDEFVNVPSGVGAGKAVIVQRDANPAVLAGVNAEDPQGPPRIMAASIGMSLDRHLLRSAGP